VKFEVEIEKVESESIPIQFSQSRQVTKLMPIIFKFEQISSWMKKGFEFEKKRFEKGLKKGFAKVG
jgi:hypothetical protein